MSAERLFDLDDACAFPSHAATTGYKNGCRCRRCRRAKEAERLALSEPLCNELGCTERRVKGRRQCTNHAPPPALKRVQQTRTCELCGATHRWYESQLHAGAREEIHELYRRVCGMCRAPYIGVIKRHRLDTPTAMRLITSEHCELCGKPFSVGHRGRTNSVVDHDHACCPTPASCGRCVRGIVCNRCNHAISQAEAIRDVGYDIVLAYLQRGPQ